MKPLILSVSALFAAGASAHPVSFEGAYQLMLGSTDSVQNFELYRILHPESRLRLPRDAL